MRNKFSKTTLRLRKFFVVSEGIKLQDFFVSFCGTFKGLRYNSDVPSRMKFPNYSLCNDFNDFVSQTTLERVADGSFLVWLEIGKVNPPHLVIPITVEPTKPRMCHDERFLNCWIRLPIFLKDLPRYVGVGHYQTTFDDKSGYDHIFLHPSSYTFFGLEWEGRYFVYITLPFGCKTSTLQKAWQ